MIPHGYCQCGCGAQTAVNTRNDTRQGDVKGEPKRFLLGHNPRPKYAQYKEEDHGYTTPCWQWQWATFNATGYGALRHDGKSRAAHRVFYERYKGNVPAGLQIDHLCRNRACVNPEHLEIVTPAENSQRGLKAKLRIPQVKEMRRAFEASEATVRQLAEMYGLTQQATRQILQRENWRNVQ